MKRDEKENKKADRIGNYLLAGTVTGLGGGGLGLLASTGVVATEKFSDDPTIVEKHLSNFFAENNLNEDRVTKILADDGPKFRNRYKTLKGSMAGPLETFSKKKGFFSKVGDTDPLGMKAPAKSLAVSLHEASHLVDFAGKGGKISKAMNKMPKGIMLSTSVGTTLGAVMMSSDNENMQNIGLGVAALGMAVPVLPEISATNRAIKYMKKNLSSDEAARGAKTLMKTMGTYVAAPIGIIAGGAAYLSNRRKNNNRLKSNNPHYEEKRDER